MEVEEFEIDERDALTWVRTVWLGSGNIVNGQHDLVGSKQWQKYEYFSNHIPDIVHGVNILPLKTLVRAICAAYEPGPNYGPAPMTDHFQFLAAEARSSYLRLQQAKRSDKKISKWSKWYPSDEWAKRWRKSPSWFRGELKHWIADEEAERKGQRGDIRFLLSFLAENEISDE